MDFPVDHLSGALQVVQLEDFAAGAAAERGARAPHRHGYHELLWTRRGEGTHAVDGEAFPIRPGTLTVIGQGRVHVLERAVFSGAVVRFESELVLDAPAWLVGGRGALTVEVPPSSVAGLEATIAILGAEAARPADVRSAELVRHFLSALLLWIERWYEGAHAERGDDADVALYRRFVALLERSFAAHHDAAWYADELAVPAAALSRTLATVTGQTTKQLITGRVMLEAARLLRFTDLAVGEVSYRTGFEDQLYFSRAFKRRYGVAPRSYRDLHRHPSNA
ncbi:AraC family transcriptional regulator [Solirubrobacter phytolaccae]|uniref:AraC family transcriptional regulator n=1 Tax=Solirubrobacter phytolaccae TaxID=1404360 RepID=A0A9X3N936_9ACTN|nr:AraC family transcriptional regulator [Solirubrobacter phytolaccae]MDA0182063.1 AraC family transcriptional regulator [Solirubrobacter phytolaccae]